MHAAGALRLPWLYWNATHINKHSSPTIHSSRLIIIIPLQHVRADTMDQTIEARILRFERSHSVPRSCDQWQLKTRLPGLDMDVRSLPSTPSLLSDTNRGLAINRCCDEVIDRLSDIMTEYSDSFKAMRDWTAWYDMLKA